MKNSLNKLLPLISKLNGKKPIVIIISVILISLGIYAVEKGYINEGMLDLGSVVDQVDQILADTTQVSDTILIEKVDTVIINVEESESIK
jgi:uncharacterized membrane protein